MAEVFGLAASVIGTVGVLGQIFDGCIKAYAFFTTAANLGRDSENLVCKIRIEEARLFAWGREWGVVEGRLEAHLQAEGRAGNERLRPLATQILTQLYRTITDFNKLQDKYGLREEASSPVKEPSKELVKEKKEPSTTSKLRKDLQLRAKWVIADKEKFGMLLQDLKDYNDGLEQLFPRDRLATLQRTWQNELLQGAQRDLGKLSLLESASSGVYPLLNASASLKKLRINLDTKPLASFKATSALKIKRNLLSISEKDSKRGLGTYESPSLACPVDVIIEWVDYDREDVEGRFNHIRRIDDLARMVHSASDRHPDLHTIDCLGYTEDVCRYGLVYRTPSASFSTLHSLISSNDLRTPDLGVRFELAHTLAVALWSFHSLDWLHKSLCSTNVLFFPSAFSSSATKADALSAMVPSIASPVLLGFDLSRPDEQAEMSVMSKTTSVADLHRHPDSLNGLSRKPYCKSFDIYSLGLILLEIGLWKVLQTYHKPHYSAAKLRDRVILPVLVPSLGSKTGSLFREVVNSCLTADDDMSSEEAGSLMETVVGTLESLRV